MTTIAASVLCKFNLAKLKQSSPTSRSHKHHGDEQSARVGNHTIRKDFHLVST